jgi:hypothetical protein
LLACLWITRTQDLLNWGGMHSKANRLLTSGRASPGARPACRPSAPQWRGAHQAPKRGAAGPLRGSQGPGDLESPHRVITAIGAHCSVASSSPSFSHLAISPSPRSMHCNRTRGHDAIMIPHRALRTGAGDSHLGPVLLALIFSTRNGRSRPFSLILTH